MTRIQLHSTEVQVTIVSLRRELDEARANALTARTSEKAARLQITRMMDEQPSRLGQSVPAFPGSRIIPTRRIDPRDASMQRMLKFGAAKIPKLTKANSVNTEVQLLIQHIHQLLRQEAFDDSVLGNLIDNKTITLLGYIFTPTETTSRDPITTHWTIDWDVVTIIEALEELYPLQAEHNHLNFGSRRQQVVGRSVSRVRVQSDRMEQVCSDAIYE